MPNLSAVFAQIEIAKIISNIFAVFAGRGDINWFGLRIWGFSCRFKSL